MTKLIFLDIDGVLDTYKSHYMLDPELMAQLGILLEITDASIVISSSWRAQDVPGTVEFMTDSDNPALVGIPSLSPTRLLALLPSCSPSLTVILTVLQLEERKSRHT